MSVQEIKRKTELVFRKYGIRRAALFGSAARGDMHEKSDVDILVDLADDASLLDMVGLKQEPTDALERKVDLVEYDSIKPVLRESILKHHVPLI